MLEFQEQSPKRGRVEPGPVEHRCSGSIPRSDARLADFYGGRGEQQPRQPLSAVAGDGERDPVITGRNGRVVAV